MRDRREEDYLQRNSIRDLVGEYLPEARHEVLHHLGAEVWHHAALSDELVDGIAEGSAQTGAKLSVSGREGELLIAVATYLVWK